MKTVIAFIIGATMATSCGDGSGPHVPIHYDYRADYLLYLASAAEPPAPDETLQRSPGWHGGCFDRLALELCAEDAGYGFWLDVTNHGVEQVRFRWPRARYVDEAGTPHIVYHWSSAVDKPDYAMFPNQAPSLLLPGASQKERVAPGYKTYNVGDSDGSLHVFQEPLVPTSLKGRTPDQMKAYIDDLARRQVPVKLLLPVEIQGVRHDYVFTFVLKPRWERW